MHAGLGSAEHFAALHELDLGAEEIHHFLGICRRGFPEAELPGHHQAALGKPRGRLLHRRPSADAEAEAEEEEQHPPALFQEVKIADALNPHPVHGRSRGESLCLWK